MKIELSHALINEIERATIGKPVLFKKFLRAVNDALDNQPKEINYKNYGAIEGTYADNSKSYGRKPTMAETFLPIDTTKLNHLSLKRDENGHFLPKYRKLKKFGYYSEKGNTIKVRVIELKDQDKNYLIGLDTQDGYKLKRFRRDRITGNIQTIREKI